MGIVVIIDGSSRVETEKITIHTIFLLSSLLKQQRAKRIINNQDPGDAVGNLHIQRDEKQINTFCKIGSPNCNADRL